MIGMKTMLRPFIILGGLMALILIVPGTISSPAQGANASQIINKLNRSLSCSPSKSKSCRQCQGRCWSAYNRCVKTQCSYKNKSGKSRYCGSTSALYGVRNDCAKKYASGSRGGKIKSCLAACK